MPTPKKKSSHRTRKKYDSPAPKLEVIRRDGRQSGVVPVDDEKPAYTLMAFLWPTRHLVSQWIVLSEILMITGLFRWALGFWDYSGFRSPPMHGDFEAQRHWMEITTRLPMSRWYFYDLEWWGLDYPPLTAYHSWLLGKIGSLIAPEWFELDVSRALDDLSLKVFMRATVLVSEFLIYVPAVVFFCRRFSRAQRVTKLDSTTALVAILMQPATMLIDHAHFQYNTVMLGFVTACLASVLSNSLVACCIYFVAALTYKQMALYYAPAIFAFLLGSCMFPLNFGRLLAIAFTTAGAFGAIFTPLLLGAVYDSYYGRSLPGTPVPPFLARLPINEKSMLFLVVAQLAQCIHRVFPFARGLFEDKVANFWCALHTFHKLHRYPTQMLQLASLGATLACILPPCVLIFYRPHPSQLPIAFAASAWSFFLFSFQVHEKSVLLPLLPMTLLLAGHGGLRPESRSWITWANVLGTWTMFPLLKRDQLRVPYFVMTLLFAWLMDVPSLLFGRRDQSISKTRDIATRMFHGGFYAVMIVWHVCEAFVPPPSTKPDLWVVANVLIGAPGFATCYLWCLWTLWQGVSTSSKARTRKEGHLKSL